VPLGLALGAGLSRWMMEQFETEIFSFPFVFDAATTYARAAAVRDRCGRCGRTMGAARCRSTRSRRRAEIAANERAAVLPVSAQRAGITSPASPLVLGLLVVAVWPAARSRSRSATVDRGAVRAKHRR
jgi:hypothetical protein